MKQNSKVDLILFMGQSNMAGRGTVTSKFPQEPPLIEEGAGYEYRAISDPTKLYPICEPFGVYENNPDGISENNPKTGSLVTSFINAYYECTQVPVVAISASKGGTSIEEWQSEGRLLDDGIKRYQQALKFLEHQKIAVRNHLLVWCQGESDGDRKVPKEQYKKDFRKIWNTLFQNGIQQGYLIQIGDYNGEMPIDYTSIQVAQQELAQEDENLFMVSTLFKEMKAKGYMKDAYHYVQAAYNEVGTDAGMNVGKHVIGRN